MSWAEDRFGDPSESRLQRIAAFIDPKIPVVRETDDLVKAFSPLEQVPANFVYNRSGKLIYGDGSPKLMTKKQLEGLLAGSK